MDGIGSVTCQCPSGYSGKLCETNIDTDSLDSCYEGGTCNACGSFDYTCDYPVSLGRFNLKFNTNSNPNVENLPELTDDCVSSPCEHGGTCMEGPWMFVCTCLSGYSGDRCEIKGELKI